MELLVVALLPAVVLGQMPGGISDTTVPPTYEPVVFAVSKINEQFAATNCGQSQLSLLEIVRARTQVVEGQKLYLTLHMSEDYYCDVTVWYRSWLKGEERLQVTDGPTCTQHQPSARALGGMPGGVSDPKPLGSAEDVVLQALNFAVCAANDRSNDMFFAILGDTSGVTYTEQVIAGMTYHFYDVPLIESNCPKQGQCAETDLASCTAEDNSMTKTCELVVHSHPWLNPPLTADDVTC